MADPLIDNVVDTIGDQATGRRLPRALTPFRVRGYRWLAASMTFGTLGGGLWIVALVWEVFGLGGGPSQLSLVSAMSALGVFIPALLGGVVADRIPQKRILLVVATGELTVVGTVAVLAGTSLTSVPVLAAAAFAIGVGMAFYYPAYSAMLPALVPEQDLMAVNGFEGMVRPALGNAAGPALAGVAIGIAAPWAAFALATGAYVVALACLLRVPATALRRDLADTAGTHPVRSALRDMREGFGYMLRTPWLLATLLFASLMILAMMGPLEVLVPYFIKSDLGGSAGDHSMVLAAFGIGSAIGSLVMSSLRMPRRYLTTMVGLWGVGSLPFAVIPHAQSVWVIVAGALVMGAAFAAPNVIWGTLLQRRVPGELLGRVSSLDFFVSISLMPVSMALVGPVSDAIGVAPTFYIAALAPAVLCVVAIVAARLPADERANPLI